MHIKSFLFKNIVQNLFSNVLIVCKILKTQNIQLQDPKYLSPSSFPYPPKFLEISTFVMV